MFSLLRDSLLACYRSPLTSFLGAHPPTVPPPLLSTPFTHLHYSSYLLLIFVQHLARVEQQFEQDLKKVEESRLLKAQKEEQRATELARLRSLEEMKKAAALSKSRTTNEDR